MEDAKEIAKMVHYFFDSYAVIELLEGNSLYSRFKEEKVIITIFNLAEIYWHFLLKDEDVAEEVFNKFHDSVVEIDDETLKEAIKFRKTHKKQDLSYADAIGYIYAERHNMKFLTGDKEFQNMGNVEFVK